MVNGVSIESLTYDADGRLDSAGYRYDTNGNLISDGNLNYAYDWEQRLTTVTQPSTGLSDSYVYAPSGLRVQVAATGGTTNYVIDEMSGFGNVSEVRNGSGNLLDRYTWGEGPLSITSGNSTEYFAADGNGSTVSLMDASANVTNTYGYDAWGNITGRTGASDNALLYESQWMDADTNLLYLRARFANPQLGNFLSPDPHNGCSQDPITLQSYLMLEMIQLMPAIRVELI